MIMETKYYLASWHYTRLHEGDYVNIAATAEC